MPIPAFSPFGVLPPFRGAGGPAGNRADLSPYEVTAAEVVAALGTTPNRNEILRNWLTHRVQLRNLGITRGFQWLDGSFVEDRIPNDLDLVTFLHRPRGAKVADWNAIVIANQNIFARAVLKANLRLDAFFVDLDGSARLNFEVAAYLLNLFSHSRVGERWKGMLRVSLENTADETAALAGLQAAVAAGAVAP